MNAPAPLSRWRQNFVALRDDVRQSRFLQDKLSVGLLVLALLIGLATIISLLPLVQPGPPSAVHYNNLYAGYALGPWYYPYLVACFGVGATLINGMLAYQAYTRSRLASFFLLSGSVVVAVFTLVIANALGHAR